MDRIYTIHEHKGLKFINLTKKTIIMKDGTEYPSENFELKSKVVLLYGREPSNLPDSMIYAAKYAEMLHLPDPTDQQWIDMLDEDIVVISKPKVCNTYTYPVCMFKTFVAENGLRYSDSGLIVWKPRN